MSSSDRSWEYGDGSRYSLRAICWLDTTSIEQEPDGGSSLALTLTEGIHQLLQLSGPLDLEEHLVVVICNLDVQVLAGATLGLLGRTWAAIIVRAGHVERA